jgi:hypothetical protein
MHQYHELALSLLLMLMLAMVLDICGGYLNALDSVLIVCISSPVTTIIITLLLFLLIVVIILPFVTKIHRSSPWQAVRCRMLLRGRRDDGKIQVVHQQRATRHHGVGRVVPAESRDQTTTPTVIIASLLPIILLLLLLCWQDAGEVNSHFDSGVRPE